MITLNGLRLDSNNKLKSTNNTFLNVCMYAIVPLNIKALHWIVP